MGIEYFCNGGFQIITSPDGKCFSFSNGEAINGAPINENPYKNFKEVETVCKNEPSCKFFSYKTDGKIYFATFLKELKNGYYNVDINKPEFLKSKETGFYSVCDKNLSVK